jgi:uncharacterized protein YndB with AHSA1/START domain
MPTVQRLIEIDAPARDVWHVLTTRDLIREWAAAVAEEIDVVANWRIGGRVTWKAPNGEERRGLITELEPGRRLTIEYPQASGPARAETFEITPSGDTARLSLSIGPNEPSAKKRLTSQTEAILQAIRSLAEELAWIRGRRPTS